MCRRGRVKTRLFCFCGFTLSFLCPSTLSCSFAAHLPILAAPRRLFPQGALQRPQKISEFLLPSCEKQDIILLRRQNHLLRASAVSSKKPRARQKDPGSGTPIALAGIVKRN